MGKSHATGWASDAPTPAQLKEFFAQIGSGKVTGVCLQAFLRGEARQSISSLTKSEQMAAEILGAGKVVGYQNATQVWNIDPPEIEPVMTFSLETLEQCAEGNKKGTDWRVVWIDGLSMCQQEKIRGRNREKRPCFNPDYTWFLEKQQDSWANQPVEAGYQLLDFAGRFGNMKWQVQEDEIGKLGSCFERAKEQVVAEAYFTIYMVSGAKECLLEDWYHWGRLLTANSSHVFVGNFYGGGLRVCGCWDGDPSLLVVLSRKF